MSGRARLGALLLAFLPATLLAQSGAPAPPRRAADPRLDSLVEAARAAVAAVPGQGEDRLARLAMAQARLGDVAGARTTARTLARTWVPWAWIAIAQRDSGDHEGALATVRMPSDSTARAQATGYLASAYAYASDHDRALAIARTIEWPKQRIEELKLVAMLVRQKDASRARELLREAVDVATRGGGFWGAYFAVELAYEQAQAGDVEGALRILSDTLSPQTRAERVGRIAAALQRASAPRADDLADSLFVVALEAADAVVDPAKRAEMRARVYWLYSSFADTRSNELMARLARTPEERAQALRRTVASRAFSRSLGDPARADSGTRRELGTVAELERSGAFREATEALRSMALTLRHRQGIGRGVTMLPSVIDTLVARAIANAVRVSPAFADTTRQWSADLLASRSIPAARETAAEIRDERLRSRAMVAVASVLMHRDRPAAIDYAAGISLQPSRDSAFLRIVYQLAYPAADSALTVARRITDPSHRATALTAIGGALALRRDSAAARELWLEALPLMNPLAKDAVANLLRSLRSHALPSMREWARRQPTPERRAEAFVAILSAASGR